MKENGKVKKGERIEGKKEENQNISKDGRWMDGWVNGWIDGREKEEGGEGGRKEKSKYKTSG